MKREKEKRERIFKEERVGPQTLECMCTRKFWLTSVLLWLYLAYRATAARDGEKGSAH